LPKINAFNQYYVHIRKQELVHLAHGDIVDCGKGVRSENTGITKFVFNKKLLYFLKIITIFVIHVHNPFAC